MKIPLINKEIPSGWLIAGILIIIYYFVVVIDFLYILITFTIAIPLGITTINFPVIRFSLNNFITNIFPSKGDQDAIFLWIDIFLFIAPFLIKYLQSWLKNRNTNSKTSSKNSGTKKKRTKK